MKYSLNLLLTKLTIKLVNKRQSQFLKFELNRVGKTMRSFYLRIREYAIEKYGPKFIICDDLLHLPRVYAIFNESKCCFLIKDIFKSRS